MSNAIFWFEIPAAEIKRAQKFYSAVLDEDLEQVEVNEGYPMFMLPSMGGAVVQGQDYYTPNSGGVLIYLDVGEKFDEIMERIEPAGGKIVLPKTDMGGHGFSAFFLDSEGNKIGLATSK